MDKIKKLITTILQLAMLIVLLETIGNAGMGALLGAGFAEIAKLIIGFGVSIIAIFGAILGIYLPTRRHRLLRDTQVHILKYISVLSLFQVLGYFITRSSGVVLSGAVGVNPMLLNVLVMTFSMVALMMPFNYVKSLFGILKSVEVRDPRRMMKQFFS